MNNAPLDIQALELTLTELAWVKQTDDNNPRMSLWVPSPTAKLEPAVIREEAGVFLPHNPEAPDFERIANRALTELADLSAANVVEELATSQLRLERTLDKFVVSTDGPAVRSGVVDWRMGTRLVEGLGEVLKSGARVSHEYKRWYQGASRVIGDNYLDSCLMGQTEVGSYVVKAFVPAKVPLSISNSAKMKKSSQVSSREVSKTVITSIQATKDVLEEFRKDGNPDAFNWAMTQGVSVEMLTGFRSLIGADETEISVEFIKTRADEPLVVSSRVAVVLEPTLTEAVEVGIATLKKAPQPTEIVVAGEVIGLMRQWDAPDSRRIKMRGAGRDGKTRVFTVHLNESDYDKALEAHGRGVLLEVSGVAEKAEFLEVRHVRVTNARVGTKEESTDRVKCKGQMDLLRDC
ncbi:hypothetical protein M3D57_11070 [Corynebacterium sanguinis]|uniref:hypothetical protein n=1 Tax=Corynebacterium sanguinis TaxID=2594913 RepID=UPI00119F732E|nr:hypothetical protein [Corynebacterium sanguinis]MCT2048026.1 hypothetical protein [Corynebacterium sanguinis]MDN8577937.1 hypothetical protein [Corynebacterium sanguinis]TVS24731.1 hypothetical protein EKI56_09560 [Corynebacterium sanguinis]